MMLIRFRDLVVIAVTFLFLTSTTSRSFLPGAFPLASAGSNEASTIARPEGKEAENDFHKLQRLFALAKKVAPAKNKTSFYEIKEYSDEEAEVRNPQAILRRKLRKQAEKMRPASEEFPDHEAERQRKRFVRKACTQLMNLAAAKQWKLDQIASQKKFPLQAPDGPKLLKAKHDKGRTSASSLKAGEGGSERRRTKKRSMQDEVIKRIGEALRDKEVVSRLMRTREQGVPLLKLIRRQNKRWTRRFEREEGLEARVQAGAATQTSVTRDVTRKAEKDKAPLRLKGGGEIEGFAAYLPMSYPSIIHWAFAMIKMAVTFVLCKLGLMSPPPPKAASTASPSASSSSTRKKKPPPPKAELPASAKEALEGASFNADRLGAISKCTVIVVTNNCIFKEEDIVKVFNDQADAAPPPIIAEALPSLLKLAQTTNLHLVTQFPHSNITDLTAYMEAHVVDSKRAVHGEWEQDKMEKAIISSLDTAGVFAAGMHNKRKCLFCETTDGRGFIARTISENTDSGALTLHVDDSPESVEWIQNVLTNTTVLGIRTDANKGKFPAPKKGSPAIVVGSIADYFEKGEE